MRKAIILGVVGLFVASGAAFAEGTSVGKGGCGWGSTKSASSGTPAQTVATDQATTTKPATAKDTKG